MDQVGKPAGPRSWQEHGEPDQGGPDQGGPDWGGPDWGEADQGTPDQREPNRGEPNRVEPDHGEADHGEAAQDEPNQGEADPGDLELAELEVRLFEALIVRDLDTFERLLAPEFTLTTGRPGAEVRSRDEWLQVACHEYDLESFAIDELIVQRYGDAAVVRVRYQQVGRLGTADRTGTYRMTDVFVRQAGGWRLVARHATQVPGPHWTGSSLAQAQPQA